jgi:hypothetical protein
VTVRPLEVPYAAEDAAAALLRNLRPEDAPRAVLLAADKGYIIEQIVAGAAENRLKASGDLLTPSGGIESPQSSPYGLFASSRPAAPLAGTSSLVLLTTTGSEVLDEAVDLMKRVDVYKGKAETEPSRAAARIAMIADSRAVSGSGEEFVTILALALLRRRDPLEFASGRRQ